jgi:2-methylcitrate dehydratase PrpD
VSYALEQLAVRGTTMQPGPAERDAACAAVLDLVTAAAAAPAQPVAAALRDAYGDGRCALWLTGERASPAAATFYNALIAARLDLDDGHRMARGHPGAAVIPAVLAEADRREALGLPLEDALILRAIVVGYEIGLRIAGARRFYARTGFWAPLAAAAGVAIMRGVSAGRFAHALAIAGETGPHMATTTAGPAWPQPNGSDVKEGIPWGVVQGLAAVSLSEAGLTGALDLVDHAPFFDRDAILADRRRAAIHEAYTKFYAACRHCHAPVDALLAVMQANRLAAIEVHSVVVGAYSGALRIPNTPNPQNLTDAQYSIPYCLGVAAHRGPHSLMTLSEAQLGDTAAEDLARKVTVTIDPECEARFPAETVVRVALQARGEQFVSAVTAPRGESAFPPRWDERLEKFRATAGATLSAAAQTRWLESLGALREGRLAHLRGILASPR